jgi:ubiquinone/menaquinone biosynthesis C-methylase UbiE
MAPVDSKERFSATVDAYERYRPGYPAALVDWLTALAGVGPGERVVDLGSGTGISTRLFAARGFDVVGVEPNDAMRARAEATGGAGVSYVRGEAQATGLPGACTKLAFAAQAFHWFDIPLTMRELARILQPGGRAAAFWNERAQTPFLDAYDALLRTYSAEYRAIRSVDATLAKLRAWPDARDLRETELANAQVLDRDGLFGRAYSSSYVVHGIADHAAFDRELGQLFDTHAQAGVVDFAYRTLVLAWQLPVER